MNFCRQIVAQISRMSGEADLPVEAHVVFGYVLRFLDSSQKFLLPPKGMLFDDPEFRALDEQRLRLPYPRIAVEYTFPGCVESGYHQATKRVILAEDLGEVIGFMPVLWFDELGQWCPCPQAAIPSDFPFTENVESAHGSRGFKILVPAQNKALASDYQMEAYVLYSLLNVLGCANVNTERTTSSKRERKLKTALPFDSYHVLKVDSPALESQSRSQRESAERHRSPREHLRRGHIRRYDSGTRIWINATVVNNRVGGVVSKDYQVVARQ